MIATIPAFMPVHQGEVTWSDFFCGAGGSSLGLHHVPGMRVKYALNHWDLAVQAHNANFPDTDHEVTVIEAVHPSRFGRTDCAWFSPSCTSHAYCGPRGNDDESVRSRATMWDVIRWTAHHRYDVVVIENVIEAKLWCDAPGHYEAALAAGKKGCSCGTTYDDWIAEMAKLGYSHQEVFFNSQHALVPQSRDRLYVVFWREGIPTPDLDFAPPSYCSSCDDVVAGVQTWKPATRGSVRDSPRCFEYGKFGENYVYTCPECLSETAPGVVGSHSIIDHDLPIDTIGSRKRPIAANTRHRIRTGIQKVGLNKSVQLQVGGNLFERPGYARLWSLDEPLRTVTTSKYMAVILRYGNAAMSMAGEPGPAVTTSEDIALVMQNMENNIPRPDAIPTPPVTTGGNHMLLTMRNNSSGQAMDQPAPSVAAQGQHHGYLVYNGTPGHVREFGQPAGTVKTKDSQSVIYPFRDGNALRSDVEPAAALTEKKQQALLEISEADIDDMLFRMLDWTELQRAQAMHAMPDGSPYLLTARVKGANGKFKDLNSKQRVRMIGNAVSSPVATMIGFAVADALAAA